MAPTACAISISGDWTLLCEAQLLFAVLIIRAVNSNFRNVWCFKNGCGFTVIWTPVSKFKVFSSADVRFQLTCLPLLCEILFARGTTYGPRMPKISPKPALLAVCVAGVFAYRLMRICCCQQVSAAVAGKLHHGRWPLIDSHRSRCNERESSVVSTGKTKQFSRCVYSYFSKSTPKQREPFKQFREK